MNYPLHKLNDEEKQIYTIIFQANRIKQEEVAKRTIVGYHPKYEKAKLESTERKVRQIVHDLRIKHGIPLISDSKGYFIAHKVDDSVEAYMAKLSATLVSHLVTYNILKKHFGMTNKQVEEQLKLFDLDQEEAQKTLLQ